MIRIENIGYRVGHKELLSGIEGTFTEGRISLVIGPNGAGKSTLIKVISGQKSPIKGQVFYHDRHIQNYSHMELARTRAVLSQHVDIAFPMSVEDVVMMGRYPHFAARPTADDRSICEQAMLLFDILEMRERNYMTLSGGEKQRVHFARVVAQIWNENREENRCLLLDEPLNSLDVYYQHQFMEITRMLCRDQNLVIVGVIHDLNLAAKYADNLILLHQGKMLGAGKPTEVLTAENIKTAYRMEVKMLEVDHTVQLLF